MPSVRLGQPVWLRRNTRENRQRFPSLDRDQVVDVAIIGGGMTGSAVATLFANAGVRVGLVEANRIGRGSTAASTALLLQEPDQGLTDLTRRYGARAARRIWELSRLASRDFVKTLRDLRIECDLIERDTVYYTTQPATVEALRSEYQRRCVAGVAGDWLTPGALRRLTGITGRGGIKTRNAQLDPYKACLGLLRAAARSGACVFEHSPVERIERLRDGVRLVTPRGTLRAAQLVIATGYAAPPFEPLAGRFSMSHTYVLATNRINRRQQQELGLGDVLLWDTERPYHYARWTPDRRLLLGGADRPLVSTPRQRATAFQASTHDLREHFEALMPALADIGIDYAWEGVFATTPDGLPYIGRHRRFPHHLFALGYGGNGMTFGYLAAMLLLQQWQGVESTDHQLFSFGRHR